MLVCPVRAVTWWTAAGFILNIKGMKLLFIQFIILHTCGNPNQILYKIFSLSAAGWKHKQDLKAEDIYARNKLLASCVCFNLGRSVQKWRIAVCVCRIGTKHYYCISDWCNALASACNLISLSVFLFSARWYCKVRLYFWFSMDKGLPCIIILCIHYFETSFSFECNRYLLPIQKS
jgi:hypothetical protein